MGFIGVLTYLFGVLVGIVFTAQHYNTETDNKYLLDKSQWSCAVEYLEPPHGKTGWVHTCVSYRLNGYDNNFGYRKYNQEQGTPVYPKQQALPSGDKEQ